MDASVAPPDTAGLRERRLGRIAELLECPVEAFADGAAAGSEVADASELVRLWLAITDRDDRRKVLMLARTLARA